MSIGNAGYVNGGKLHICARSKLHLSRAKPIACQNKVSSHIIIIIFEGGQHSGVRCVRAFIQSGVKRCKMWKRLNARLFYDLFVWNIQLGLLYISTHLHIVVIVGTFRLPMRYRVPHIALLKVIVFYVCMELWSVACIVDGCCRR